ncbi:MAG TPA: penicillin-binding protein 2 [Vicinamibacterales bacterium]|nr:penicillin-binding protein 2 [Vicinamibacterales bacterium]
MSTHFAPDDRRNLTTRLSLLQGAIAVVFALLAIGFWVFQVAQHQKFREMAENNHTRRLPMPAPRGILFDRHGTVLVDNQYMYNITLDREQSRNIGETLRVLERATGVPEADLRETLNRRRGEPSYRPLVLIENATEAQVIAMLARRSDLPGVSFENLPTRKYPASDMAAHLFGYVSEVNEAQLSRPEYEGLEAGARVGQAGVEQAYNKLLMGTDGGRAVAVNSLGREIFEVDKDYPLEGRRLQLTIDADVQRATEEGFRHFKYNGAAVIVDPRSGEILSLVSLPAYDPNEFALGIDPATWRSLTTDRLRPLQNRALQGRYSPGSTFKIAVAVAALEEGVITPERQVFCPGGANFYGRFFNCWLAGGHGSVNMRHALERSCNTYFYTIGNMLGVDRIHKWSSLLGLGEPSGIDLPNEVRGLVPSTEWKQRVMKEKWYPGETISVAIGQGQVSVTPLSMAVMMMTVANGGTRYTPHVLKAVDEGKGWTPVPAPPPQSVAHMKQSTVDALHEGLWMVVNAAGTGGRGKIVGYNVAGKTGTAQVVSNQGRAAAARAGVDVRDHGWFVFFAPHDKPEIAGVIFAEHAEHGYLGAPIAKYAMETYFAKKEGRPLPSLQTPAPPVIAATTATATPGQNR